MEFSSGAIEGTSKASMILPLGLISAKLVDKIKGRKFLVYLPQRSWGKVMFLHVSVILFTWGVCLSACWDTTHLWEQNPPEQTPPPGVDNPPRPGKIACWEIRARSGRYASYWNAFLFSRSFSSNTYFYMQLKITSVGKCIHY